MVSPSMPDSSAASRNAAPTNVLSDGSQCPPSCSQAPTRGCSVSNTSVPEADSTSADAVICPGSHDR